MIRTFLIKSKSFLNKKRYPKINSNTLMTLLFNTDIVNVSDIVEVNGNDPLSWVLHTHACTM